jgi:hypothetical protein
VEQGQYQDCLQCKFEEAFLSDDTKPTYETISYVWGDASVRDVVFLQGQKLEVPASAVAALKRIRYRDKARIVWIDAICINQQDTDERNSQVSLMCDIYSHATTNLIWPGEEDGSSEEVLEMIQALFDEAQLETNDFVTWSESVRVNGTWALSRVPSAVKLRKEPLFQFYSRPWFSRLWWA